MFQRTGEIVSEIEVHSLKTYKVNVKGGSVRLSREA